MAKAMRIISYIHPIRTYLPCTGAGRYINNMTLGLSQQPGVDLALLYSKEWLEEGQKLDARSPLRNLQSFTFPTPENITERRWKLMGRPIMDRYLPSNVDWVFTPMETYIPISQCPVATTIFDVQAFESELPWSDTWHHKWFGFKWARWVRKALRDSRVIFTISEFSKQRMVELLGGDPNKIVVTGVGVEQAFFNISHSASQNSINPVDTPYTLIIGGLRHKKGANYVLDVAKELSTRGSNIHIVVCGDSEPVFVEAAQRFPNIILLGMVDDKDLPGLLYHSSSLLFLSPYEGFGIPAAEAMAIGTPAIVSNCASLPEVVGDAGIIIEPEQKGEIVDAIVDIERDSTLRTKYSRLGKERATQYKWSKCVEKASIAFQHYA